MSERASVHACVRLSEAAKQLAMKPVTDRLTDRQTCTDRYTGGDRRTDREICKQEDGHTET